MYYYTYMNSLWCNKSFSQTYCSCNNKNSYGDNNGIIYVQTYLTMQQEQRGLPVAY